MDDKRLSAQLHGILRGCQRDELLGAELYAFMARREKQEQNRELLLQMSADEYEHAETWRQYTGVTMSAPKLKLLQMKLTTLLLGYTFVLKKLQKDEQLAVAEYQRLLDEVPEAAAVQADEKRHEAELIGMLNEERLQYVGAMVLGLNDALVELTGAIAGITFALANTHLVALTGIITGVSATFSMAASNYLAERADGNPNALKSSFYTGVAYLVTVALLVLPYLLFPVDMYVPAFATMIATVILIILFFNYYISVAKDEPFLRRFGEMAVISLSVALLAFIIGLLAKNLLGLDVG
ncbi:MAG: VIT1/CCC1 transporter family protein [Bacillota bacterium]|nr:VIT1/CCC1 transporter family protein [Bacillota bacterium]